MQICLKLNFKGATGVKSLKLSKFDFFLLKYHKKRNYINLNLTNIASEMCFLFLAMWLIGI